MKIGIIIPDRNDRPEFLQNCFNMLASQEIEIFHVSIKIVNHEPLNSECDITPRYRIGYDHFRNKGYDCILLIENDDYYSPNYIKTMLSEWINHGKPEIFGTNYTYYYHIGMLKYKKLIHYKRASAMNTLIKPDLNIVWPVDNDPYTDLHLWKQLKGVTFEPKEIISLGIKHNVGKTGGQYHNSKLERYDVSDPNMTFLMQNTTSKSFNFYKSIHEKIQSSFN